MKRLSFLLRPAVAITAALVFLTLVSCTCHDGKPTGRSVPDKGWLFLKKGSYTLNTKVDAAPGSATFCLVKDLSLMADTPEVVLSRDVTIAPDSTLKVRLGRLAPGFYEVR